MNQKCCICGQEHDERWMIPYQTSRVQWMCWKCFKLGQFEVGQSEVRRAYIRQLKKQRKELLEK